VREGLSVRRFKRPFARICLLTLMGFLTLDCLAISARTLSWEPREVVKKYLLTHYPWAEIEIMDLSTGDTLPNDPPKRIHLISGPLGRAVFSLVFKSGEKAIVHAHIRALDWVVTSRRPLKHHQVIQKEDIYLALTDVRRMPKGSLAHLEDVWGKTMNRSLGVNMPFSESLIGDIPLIKKGQRVTLVASAVGLKITTLGVAREDGFPGQQIRVVTLSSKRNIWGIPLDENCVRVDY